MLSPQQFLRDTGFRPKKALGQNFLIHSEGADKIVQWAGVQNGDRIVEVGPGLGALTDALGRAGCFVTAIEKDPALFDTLREHWPETSWLRLLNLDALSKLDEVITNESATSGKIKVVSNLPYSISTPLLEILLDRLDSVQEAVLLMQEEVVDRIASPVNTSDYGRLSIWVQTLCEVEKGPRITRGSFFPTPDVESKLIRLKPRTEPLVPLGELTDFLNVVALVFQHRRKTLKNALRSAKRLDWNIERALETTGIDPARRPQTLTIPEFLALSREL